MDKKQKQALRELIQRQIEGDPATHRHRAMMDQATGTDLADPVIENRALKDRLRQSRFDGIAFGIGLLGTIASMILGLGLGGVMVSWIVGPVVAQLVTRRS